jgi:hypothetical protein
VDAAIDYRFGVSTLPSIVMEPAMGFDTSIVFMERCLEHRCLELNLRVKLGRIYGLNRFTSHHLKVGQTDFIDSQEMRNDLDKFEQG